MTTSLRLRQSLFQKEFARFQHTASRTVQTSEGVVSVPTEHIELGSAVELRLPSTLLDTEAVFLHFDPSLKLIRADMPQDRNDPLPKCLVECSRVRSSDPQISKLIVVADKWSIENMPRAVKMMLLRGLCWRLAKGEPVPVEICEQYRSVLQNQKACMQELWEDTDCRPAIIAGGLISVDFLTSLLDDAMQCDSDPKYIQSLLVYRSKWFSREEICAAERRYIAAKTVA